MFYANCLYADYLLYFLTFSPTLSFVRKRPSRHKVGPLFGSLEISTGHSLICLVAPVMQFVHVVAHVPIVEMIRVEVCFAKHRCVVTRVPDVANETVTVSIRFREVVTPHDIAIEPGARDQ